MASSFWDPGARFINKKNLFVAKDIEVFPKDAYRRLTQIWENLVEANWITARVQKKRFQRATPLGFGDRMLQMLIHGMGISQINY